MEPGAIGIDIGSLNTVIAVVRNRGVEIVQSESGHVTPTIVGLGDSERKMGDAASAAIKSNFKNTVRGFNRFLGMKQNSPALKEELKFVAAKCVPKENQGIGFELRYRGESQVFTPEQLSAMYMLKLKKIYETAGIGCKDVVISVPPYFSAVERQALLDSTKIAGLNCCKLLNETTAIGLCYGLFRHSEFGDKPRYVMFVDMGYSKLTVSVMEFKSTQFSILAQGWEPNLGARNMDAAVIDKLANDFQAKYKKDLRENQKAMIRMSEAMERVRKVLSANTETPINIESIMDERDIYYNMKRQEFETIIAPCLEKIGALCRRVLAESKVKPEDIHSIEMVGEATRIPSVIQKVQECLKAPITRTMNSADCVARGCAIQCAMLSPLFKVKDYGIIDHNPFPIDVVYNLPKNEKGEEPKKSRTLFDKGSNFPVVKALSFENRKEPVELQLMYSPSVGALPLGGPTLLGNYKINPGSPAEEKFVLTIKITLDHNMIPYVSSAETIEDYFEEKKVVVKKDAPTPPPAKKEEKKAEEPKPEEKKPEEKAAPEKMTDVPNSDKAEAKSPAPAPPTQEYEIQKVQKKRKTPIDFQYEVHGLSAKKITEFADVEKKMEHEDYMIVSTKERKNALESYIYETRAKISGELKDYTDPATANNLLTELEVSENWLFGEGREQAKDAYEAKLADLQKVGGPIMARYRAFEAASDHGIMLGNVIQKAADFCRDTMSKDERYTAEDKDAISKLIAEQTEWLEKANATLKAAPKTVDPPVKDIDMTERIQKIEETVTKMVNKPKPEAKKAEVKKEEAKKEEAKKTTEKMEDVPAPGAAGTEKMQP